MRLNALLPRLLWNLVGAASLFGPANGAEEMTAPAPSARIAAGPDVVASAGLVPTSGTGGHS